MSVSDEALRQVAGEYTREAGVRQLERAIAKVLRKVATKLASTGDTSVAVDEDNLREFLGRPRFLPESAERTAVPGVATGLAVTGTGGDVLFIEATAMEGESRLTLTGQLGDVMKESAQIALSYLRSHGLEHGIDAGGARARRAPARAGRCGAEGRPVRGRHDGHRAVLAGDRATGALRRRHDR